MNNQTLASGLVPLSAVIWDKFRINGLDVNNIWIVGNKILTTKFSDDFSVNLLSYEYPLSDGKGFISEYFRGRTITFDLALLADTEENYQNLVDNLRKFVSKSDIYIDQLVNGKYRRIKANIKQNPTILSTNSTCWKASLTFEALDSFWEDVDYLSKTILWIEGNFVWDFKNTGTVRTNFIVYVIFRQNTNISGLTLSLHDVKLQINEAFVENDVLEINWETKQVLKNNQEIDYQGFFPILETETNILNLSFNEWETVSYDLSIIYKSKYV